jgi:sugar phosphate isomerase/epimerase
MTDRTRVTRREALSTMTMGAAAAALGLPALAACAKPSETSGTFARPGLQLYTMRAEMERNVEETLARVAQVGYKEVEFAGYFGRTPAQVAANLKLNGLVAPSAHVGLDSIGEGWDQRLDEAATVGHQWLIVAYLTEAQRGGADVYKRLAASFNTAAATARARGISFGYHNHDFEFLPVEGGTDGQTILLTECDPTLVDFELDLYWITKAGKDAAEYMTRYPGRFPLVHVKDMAADGQITEVGAGSIDFQKIIDASQGTIEHFYVEQDNATVPFESITTSLEAMKRFRA